MASQERIGLEAVLITKQFEKGLKVYITGTTKMVSQTAKTSKAMSGLAKGAIAGLGVSLFNLGSRGVQSVIEGFKSIVREGTAFTKSMSNVRALTGATGKDFTNLENTARTLGKTTKFTATEASEGMAFLSQAGFETNEVIQALPGTLDLASAANIGLGLSADIVSNVLTGFGATASSTGRFVDVLTNTFTTSNTNLVQLGAAMKFAAPIAASLGLSVEETAAAIGKMGDAGIQGALAGTTFRGALLALASPTKKAADVMDEFGIEIFDASGEMLSLPQIIGNVNRGLAGLSQEQEIAALKTLVGTRRLAGFQVLLNQGQTELAAYTESLGRSGTASEIAATQLDNLAGDLTLLNSAISGLQLDVFDSLEQGLRGGTQSATGFVLALDEAVLGVQEAARNIKILTEATGTQSVADQALALHTKVKNAEIALVRQAYANAAESTAELVTAGLRLVFTEEQIVGAVTDAVKATDDQATSTKRSIASTQGFAIAQEKAAKSATKMADEVEEEANALEKLSGVFLKAAKFGTDFLTTEEKLEKISGDRVESIGAETSRLTLLAQAYGKVAGAAERTIETTARFDPFGEETFTGADVDIPTQREDIAAIRFAKSEQAKIDVNVDTAGIKSAVEDGLNAVKAAIGQVSGLTFQENLPVEETFRVDEWVRRLQAVATDGKNEWIGAITEQFGGQEFFSPFEDALASGDPSAISAAAEGLITGEFLFNLMDIEGAIEQVEGIIAEENLQQRINDAILAGIAGGGELAEGGEGGGIIAGALGLGEDSTLIDELIPTLDTAIGTLATNTTSNFENVLLATQKEDVLLLKMTSTTVPGLQSAIVAMAGVFVTKMSEIDKAIAKTDEGIRKLADTIGKEIVDALGKAIKATSEWATALERALKARSQLRPGGGPPGAGAGIGFRQGVGFQQGTLGFRVPAGFPNDSFPINVTSGERIVVSPPGRSIEQVTGLGTRTVEININGVSINNGMDLNMFEGRVTRAVTEGFTT